MRNLSEAAINGHLKQLFRDPTKIKAELMVYDTNVDGYRNAAYTDSEDVTDPRYIHDGLVTNRVASWEKDYWLLGDYVRPNESATIRQLMPDTSDMVFNIDDAEVAVINAAHILLEPLTDPSYIGREIMFDASFNISSSLYGVFATPRLIVGSQIGCYEVLEFSAEYETAHGIAEFVGDGVIDAYEPIVRVNYHVALRVVTVYTPNTASYRLVQLGLIDSLYAYKTEDNLYDLILSYEGTIVPGYTSTAIADANGVINDTFSVLYAWLDQGNQVKDIRILFKEPVEGLTVALEGADFTRTIVEPQKEFNFHFDTPISFYGIRLEVAKVAPQQRVHLDSIFYGHSRVYYEADIASLNFTASEDNTGSELLAQDISLSLINIDHEFDIDNPKGIYAEMKPGLRLNLSFGIPMGDEEEWVQMASLRLKDEPTVTQQVATLKFVDELATMNNEGFGEGFSGDLQDFARRNTNVCKVIGATEDRAFMLPALEDNQRIQLTLNALNAYAHMNSLGLLELVSYLAGFKYKMTDIYLTSTDILGDIMVSKITTPRNIIVSSTQYTESDDTEETIYEYTENFIRTEPDELAFKCVYSPSADARYEGEQVISPFSSRFGSEKADIRMSFVPNGKPLSFKLIGKPLNMVSREYVREVNAEGTDCKVDNPGAFGLTASDYTGVLVYCDWLEDNFEELRMYEFDVAQDYRIEPGDCIYIQTRYEDKVPVRVISCSYTKPGIKGHIKAKRLSSRIANL